MSDRLARVVRESLALLLVHALGIIAVSYCHHVTPPPTRQGWFLFEFAIAVLLWWPARLLVNRLLVPSLASLEAGTRRGLLALSVVFGVFLVVWWGSPFADTLWVHRPSWQPVLHVVLQAAEALAISVITLTVGLSVALIDRRLFPLAVEPVASTNPTNRLVSVGLFVACMTVTNVFTVWFVRQEQTVYYWDFMVYWNRTAEFAETCRSLNPSAIGSEFSQSVRNDDYGLTPALAPAVIVASFGDTRLVYLLAIVNLYLGSVAVVGCRLVTRLLPGRGWFAVAVPLVLTILCPICWMALIRGYLDIGGVAIVLAILLLYLRQPVTQLRLSHVLQLIALLALLALFRRWYCFFIVAFFLLAGIDATLAALRMLWTGGRFWAAVRGFWSLMLVGCGLIFTLSTVATPWVYRVLTTNYADAYTAYKSKDPLLDRVSTVLNNCGWVPLAFVALGFVLLLCYRETRRAGLFLTFMAPIMLVHFLRTQDPGTHHYYLLLPTYLLVPSLAAVRLLGGASVTVRLGLLAMLIVVEGLLMMWTFWPQPPIDRTPVAPLVSPLRYPPLVRSDLPELQRLLQTVESHAAAENGLVAVVSSSPTLNTTTVHQANRSLQEKLIDVRRVLPSQEVDRVNGFPSNIFRASIVIVANPPQTHLTPDEQQVVSIPTEFFLSGTGIGGAFEKLPEVFQLENGVCVMLYRRTRAVTVEEFRAFCERLEFAHPETAFFYKPPRDAAEFLAIPKRLRY